MEVKMKRAITALMGVILMGGIAYAEEDLSVGKYLEPAKVCIDNQAELVQRGNGMDPLFWGMSISPDGCTTDPATMQYILRTPPIFASIFNARNTPAKEVLRITNTSHSEVEIKNVVMNGRNDCATARGLNVLSELAPLIGSSVYSIHLKMGEYKEFEYSCSGTVIEVKIETDKGTMIFTWKPNQ